MIQYAILGLLSWQPLSGYDLKKIFAESTVLYWSGNSNQIYRALVALHEAGLVTFEVQQQEDYPAKKVYSITDAGRARLKSWVLSAPEPPELHNTFLVQLAWADLLSEAELDALLAQYEHEMEIQMRMQQEKARRKPLSPERTARESFLWDQIAENQVAVYANELDWVRRLRKELNQEGYKK